VLNRDNPHFDRLAEKARAAGAKMIWGFGVHSFSNARLLAYEPDATGARVEATVGSQHLKYRIAMPGKHWALNSIAVLAAASSLGADLEKAAAALADVTPTKGRGQFFTVKLEDGSLGVIDETYNASPVARRVRRVGGHQTRPRRAPCRGAGRHARAREPFAGRAHGSRRRYQEA
jgi:UDP-N-acetylmuramoyl-tripeptide--D-alanyl-D-alanine ligase